MESLFGTILRLLLVICTSQLILGCTQTGKSSVNCFGLYHKDVPQNLRDSVEILNLANNKIRKIYASSFKRYTKLRVLKLYDNSIFYIEKGSLEILSDLQELDMSTNAITSVPLEIFSLPSLRILFLDSNPLKNLVNDVLALEHPISSPLEYINLADCELEDIPNLGVLPKLKHLNASMNPLSKISFQPFFSLCALESIDLLRNDMPYCKCQEILDLAEAYYHKTIPDRLNFCDKPTEKCPDPTLEDKMLVSDEYQKCTYTVSHPPISKKTWIIIGVVLGVIFILVIILVRQFQKKRQKKKLKKKKMAKSADIDKLFIYNNNNGAQKQKEDSDLNELTSSPA